MTPEQKKVKALANWRKWYAAHKEQHKEYRHKYNSRTRERRNAWLRDYRAKKKAERNRLVVETQQERPAQQVEMFASKVHGKCNCRDYTHCMECRNAEKRAAFRENRVPVYRVQALQPAASD
jgi:N-acetylmuramoyl-L-alanine amidase CwlA